MTTHIQLWSGPRNISTAMMYSFAQRDDTAVVDEPLYAHFLRVSGVDHPGRQEVLATMDDQGGRVMAELLDRVDRPGIFAKQMAHHLVDLDRRFLTRTRNILLYRHPARVIRSYTKVIEQPTLRDIGTQESHVLLEDLSRLGAHVILVDSDRFLEDPEAGLRALCQTCDIPYQSAMLHWEAGARPEDGSWARYWYASVHRSTGFGPPPEDLPDLPPQQEALGEEAMIWYHKLQEHAANL